MIYKNSKKITQVLKENRTISAIYKGAKIVWLAIRSCFESGAWRNDKPWINNEGWRNNT